MPEEKQTPETPPSPQSPALRDKRVLPEGVVPKQAQGYVIAGLSVMILMTVMFSKNHAKPANAIATPTSTPISTDANARKIEELKENLSAEQRQVQTQKFLAGNASPDSSAASAQPVGTISAPLPSASTTEPQRDPIADAERELAFKARFASNLIVSADARAVRATTESADTSLARSTNPPSQAAVQTASSTKRAPEVNLNSALGQPFVLFEGTTIDTVLTNRLDGEFAGPVKVMLSNPVYSHDRQHILIPEGTFILGDVQRVSGFGQKRLAVVFHRLLMPDGYSVDLDQFHGLDQIGDTGLKDKVNNHYMQIFGASIALGIIAGAAQSSTNSGYNQSGSDSYRQGVASSLSQSSTNVLDKFINILPTITIREGHRIKVYLTQDMLLPAYENHSMPEVF
jgi:type IV secretion system protein VirB10